MALPHFLLKLTSARRIGPVPPVAPPQPGRPFSMPLWLAEKRMVLLFVLVAVVALALMARLFVGWGPSAPASGTAAAPATLSIMPPSYRSTYPMQAFTVRTPPRNVVFTRLNDPDPTFKALDFAKLKNLRAVSATNASQLVLEQRTYLARHNYSWSPSGFLDAARRGDLAALQAYLQAGMAVDVRNAFSSTALHAAAESNQLEAAKLLLAAGADINAVTTNLQTPLHRAVAQGFPAMTQLLITAGAKTDAATVEGWTPLFYAVDGNNQELIAYLIERGANPNLQDRFGNAPLTIAARKNYLETVRNLIKLGAKANATDLMGRTALHYAVGGGFYQLTKVLLENGAKADIRDRNGILPMDIALANQDLAIANLLLANGAKRPSALGRSRP